MIINCNKKVSAAYINSLQSVRLIYHPASRRIIITFCFGTDPRLPFSVPRSMFHDSWLTFHVPCFPFLRHLFLVPTFPWFTLLCFLVHAPMFPDPCFPFHVSCSCRITTDPTIQLILISMIVNIHLWWTHPPSYATSLRMRLITQRLLLHPLLFIALSL